ncbi:hypothetical protein VTO73DRAFT_11464 [Trametes versicolor]
MISVYSINLAETRHLDFNLDDPSSPGLQPATRLARPGPEDDTAAAPGQDLIHPATCAPSQALPLASCESVRPARAPSWSLQPLFFPHRPFGGWLRWFEAWGRGRGLVCKGLQHRKPTRIQDPDDTAARLGQVLIHPATLATLQSPAACIVRVGQACVCILVIAAAIFFPHPLRLERVWCLGTTGVVRKTQPFAGISFGR